MNNTFLAKLIKSNAKRRMRFLSVTILLLAVILGIDYKNIKNYFLKIPLLTNLSEVKKNSGDYVILSFLEDNFYDSGFSKILSEDDNEIVKKYFYGIIDVKDGFFLLKIPYKYRGRELFGKELIGKLEKVDGETLIVLNHITPMTGLDVDVFKKLPSFVIKIAGADFVFNKIKFVFLFLLILFLLISLLSEFVKYQNYKLSKAYRSLKTFGNPNDIENIIEHETDVDERCIIALLPNVIILRSFIIANDKNKISIIPSSDLLWVYRKNTTRWFFKKETFLMLYFYESSLLKLRVEDDLVAEDFIYNVNERLTIVAGYFEDIKKMYCKDKKKLQLIVNA